MKIKIICDCGAENEILSSDVRAFDVTPCSCGCCKGEKFEIIFGECEKCKKTLSCIEGQ